GPLRFRNQTNPAYTLSPSGNSSVSRKVVVAKQLSLIRSPDVLKYGEKRRLGVRWGVVHLRCCTLDVVLASVPLAPCSGALALLMELRHGGSAPFAKFRAGSLNRDGVGPLACSLCRKGPIRSCALCRHR